MVSYSVVLACRRSRDDRPLTHVAFNVADLVPKPQEVKFDLVFVLARVQPDLDTGRASALACHVVVVNNARDDVLAV